MALATRNNYGGFSFFIQCLNKLHVNGLEKETTVVEHPQSGMVYNSVPSVCLLVCMSVRRQLSKALMYEVRFSHIQENTGHVCI